MFKNVITNQKVSGLLVIILTALILIVVVIWFFDKRINVIEKSGKSTSYSTGQKN